MNYYKRILITGCFGIVGIFPAFAQSIGDDDLKEIAKDELNSYDPSVGSDNLDAVTITTAPSFQISTASDSSRVKLSAGRRASGTVGTDGKLRSYSWTYALSSPINKDEDLTDLATLDSLANSTNFSISFRRTVTSGFRPSSKIKQSCDYPKLIETIRARCAATSAADGLYTDDEKQRCEAGTVEFSSVSFSTKQLNETGCGLLDPSKKQNTTFYGGTAKLGYEEFDVFDPMSLEKSKVNETPFVLAAFVGHVSNQANTSILAGVEYQNGYKADDTQTVCMTPDMAGLQTCKTGAFSDPVEQDKELLFLELRQKLSISSVLNYPIAIEPRISHDFEEEVFAVDVPIYLVRDEKSALTGGLRIGYRDDTEDVTFGLFVGSRFSIFGAPDD